MTSVEWLEQQLGSKIADANIRISAPKFYELINQAKEMEKQQIIDAFEQGDYTGRGFEDLTSEEYYYINFKSK
jgi:disulfide oxidoreductase YuzD